MLLVTNNVAATSLICSNYHQGQHQGVWLGVA